MKTVGFCTVFIADMNSACKNTLVSVYLLNFHRRDNFDYFHQRLYPCDSANFLKNFRISNFAFICLLFHLKIIFDDFL